MSFDKWLEEKEALEQQEDLFRDMAFDDLVLRYFAKCQQCASATAVVNNTSYDKEWGYQFADFRHFCEIAERIIQPPHAGGKIKRFDN